jgi:hypothetical protein
MKIGFHGLDLPEGKVKYHDEKLLALEHKCQPKKTAPYFVEFLRDEFVHVDAILIHKTALLDLLILDIEKCETRRDRSADPAEQALLQKCLALLEAEQPLCDASFSEDELTALRAFAPASLKPTACVDGPFEPNAAIERMLAKANIVFFYTAGKPEVHAWPVPGGSDIVTCAGKIHSDLARGFIRADVVAFDDYMSVHGLAEAKQRGLLKAVGREYIIRPGDIIEIHFSV